MVLNDLQTVLILIDSANIIIKSEISNLKKQKWENNSHMSTMYWETMDKKMISYWTNNKLKQTHLTVSNQSKHFCHPNTMIKVTMMITSIKLSIQPEKWSYREFKVNRNHWENYVFKEEKPISFFKSLRAKISHNRTHS